MEPRISAVAAMDNARLLLMYETGERRIFDVSPYIRGDFFGQLVNPGYFALVRVTEGGSCVAWPNDQDISPEDLYRLSVPA